MNAEKRRNFVEIVTNVGSVVATAGSVAMGPVGSAARAGVGVVTFAVTQVLAKKIASDEPTSSQTSNAANKKIAEVKRNKKRNKIKKR